MTVMISRTKLNCIGIVVILLLTSCITIGKDFELAPISEIQIGKTTMSEARALFGPPFVESHLSLKNDNIMVFGKDNIETVWSYTYMNTAGGTKNKDLGLYFDKEGRLADYYYANDYKEDNIEKVNEDFDIFAAKNKVIPGKTNKDDVKVLLGEVYKKVDINKPGVAERWSYQYSINSKDETVTYGTITIPKTYGKSADVDFDNNGIVVHVQGVSNFPEDKDKFFTK